jgi:antirestriction protein ArdC
MAYENKEIDYSKIENQTRLLVDYVYQNPDLFINETLGIVVIPYEVNLLAKEYASDKNKDIGLIGQFSKFLDSQEEFREVDLGGDTGYYLTSDDLQGMTPRAASAAFLQATSSASSNLEDLRLLVEQYDLDRYTQSNLYFDEYLDRSIYKDFYAPKIEHLTLNKITMDFRKIDESKILPRPKSDFEKELEMAMGGHSDIQVLEGEYEDRKFKDKQVDMTDKAEAFLIKHGEKLIKIIEEGGKTNIWMNPIFTLQAKNPVSNYVYNIENMSALNDYVSEHKYKTALFVSYNDAERKGLIVPKGTVSHEIIQRFGIKSKEIIQLVDGKEEPVLDINGKQQYYWKRGMKTVNVFNIDQLQWKHTDKPDPREQWIADYNRPSKYQASNEAEIKLFSDSMKRMIQADGIKIVDGGKTCFFSPGRNVISMSTLFKNSLSEVGVLSHEFSHSTGVKGKKDRECLHKYNVSEAYRGMEELVANCSARKFIMNYGLDANELNDKYHKSEEAYDLSWALPVFKKDPTLIMKSMIMAEQAFQYSKEKMDAQLKTDNLYEMFVDEKSEYKKPTPLAENTKPFNKAKSNNNYKRRATV